MHNHIGLSKFCYVFNLITHFCKSLGDSNVNKRSLELPEIIFGMISLQCIVEPNVFDNKFVNSHQEKN